MEGPRRTRRTGRGQCRLGEQGLGLPWGSHRCQPFKHQQAGVHRGQSGLSSWSALPHAEARVTWLTVTSGENRAARSSCPARSRQGRGGREESPLKQTVAFRLRTGSGLELLVLEAASGATRPWTSGPGLTHILTHPSLMRTSRPVVLRHGI